MSEEKLNAKEAWKKQYMKKGAGTFIWGGVIAFFMIVAALTIAGITFGKGQITGNGVAIFYVAAILGLGMALFLLGSILDLLRDIKKELIGKP